MKSKNILNLLLLLGVLGSCTQFNQRNIVVLKIKDRTWKTKDFKKELAIHLEGLRFSPEEVKNEEEIKNEVLNDIILKTLIKNWLVQKNHLQSTSSVFFKAFPFFRLLSDTSKIKKKFNEQNLHEIFVTNLKKQTKTSLKEQLSFYKKNKKMFFQSEKCDLSQILVSSKSFAENLRKKLLFGRSFSKMAKRYSISPEKSRGGRLGWLTQKNFDIFNKACKAGVNRISPIYESPYGFHIIKVHNKRRAYYKNFESVKNKIIEELKNQKSKKLFEKWLEKELRRTPISINKNLLDQIHIQYKTESL